MIGAIAVRDRNTNKSQAMHQTTTASNTILDFQKHNTNFRVHSTTIRTCYTHYFAFLALVFFLTDPNDFRIKNHDFSVPATNYIVLVIEAVQNVKIRVFLQLPGVDRYFVTF